MAQPYTPTTAIQQGVCNRATVCKEYVSTETHGAYCYVEYEDIKERNRPLDFPPRNEWKINAASQNKASS